MPFKRKKLKTCQLKISHFFRYYRKMFKIKKFKLKQKFVKNVKLGPKLCHSFNSDNCLLYLLQFYLRRRNLIWKRKFKLLINLIPKKTKKRKIDPYKCHIKSKTHRLRQKQQEFVSNQKREKQGKS